MFKFSTAESLIINILGVAIDEKLIEGSHIDTVVKEHTRSRGILRCDFLLNIVRYAQSAIYKAEGRIFSIFPSKGPTHSKTKQPICLEPKITPKTFILLTIAKQQPFFLSSINFAANPLNATWSTNWASSTHKGCSLMLF